MQVNVFACNVINHIANKEAIPKNIAPNLLKRKREEIPTMCEAKKIVEELRNKKSRDNRELLDRSANMIEKLAKELCEKSGCHHKCHDTKDCVVVDEAKAIIGNNLPSTLTNEKKISEKEKQIEEMCEVLRQNAESCKTCSWREEGLCVGNCELAEENQAVCEALYNAGYRKIVMCKDCAHYSHGQCYVTNRSPLFKYNVNIHSRKEDDFCSYGEMKGGE